ncbi:oxidoreductase [Paludibacterium purpuratum]|uniref:Putative dehydrogenase n=1 Tax=Paludibacterium purpuratum TaxID=1144873 RepID=A0A4R7B4R5_9NEIS|nr:oxidoreductase [Paludibacterium purpuratum]TDR77765.1 putative dehydrogenase [Paludibacterium purpuratum]
MPSPAPLNVALSGYGYAGKTFHAPLIDATPGLALHTIVSRRADAVLAERPDCRVVPDLAQALADPSIDLVVIASPNELHFPQARDALLAGKHVVVDKPFTTKLDEALRLNALASETRQVLSVFHNRRWDSDFLALSALLADGALGRISRFESRFDRYRPQTRQRWREEDRPGAGLWYDLGAHLVDQVLHLFGLPQAVHGTLLRQREGAQVDDFFDVRLRYADFVADLQASCLAPGGSPRLTVHGSKASYVKHGLDTQEGALKQGIAPDSPGFGADAQPAVLWLANGDTPQAVYPVTASGQYVAYYAAVRDAVLGKGPNPVTALEAARVIQVIEAVAQSHRESREIALSAEALA